MKKKTKRKKVNPVRPLSELPPELQAEHDAWLAYEPALEFSFDQDFPILDVLPVYVTVGRGKGSFSRMLGHLDERGRRDLAFILLDAVRELAPGNRRIGQEDPDDPSTWRDPEDTPEEAEASWKWLREVLGACDLLLPEGPPVPVAEQARRQGISVLSLRSHAFTAAALRLEEELNAAGLTPEEAAGLMADIWANRLLQRVRPTPAGGSQDN